MNRLATRFADRPEAILGRLGEQLVAEIVRRRGAGVIASYDYSGAGNDKAPRMQFERSAIAIPDLDVCSAGRRSWLEVKTYKVPGENRKLKIQTHGIRRRHHEHYKQVAIFSGCPVWLCIVEVASGLLLGASLSDLRAYECQCRGCQCGRSCQAPTGIRDQVYFDRAAFAVLHTFTDAEILPIRLRLDPQIALPTPPGAV